MGKYVFSERTPIRIFIILASLITLSTPMIKKGDKRTIRGWIFYDWANSVYPLVITTALFPTFYEGLTKGENGEGVINFFGFELLNTAAYSYVISASFLVVSIMSPMLSGIADFVGRKKLFLQFFCYLGAFSCASLFFFDKNCVRSKHDISVPYQHWLLGKLGVLQCLSTGNCRTKGP